MEERAFTSDEVFSLKQMPKRILIVGRGYISMEFAGIFHGLGAEVTVVCRSAMVLNGFDEDVQAHLAKELIRDNLTLHLKADVDRVDKVGDHFVVSLSDADGAIIVDKRYRTSVANIYALGDVTDRINLTPVAIAEGHALADTLFGTEGYSPSYENVPTAVFSNPPVGMAGLTEVEAKKRHGAVDVYRSDFRPLRHALSGSPSRTLVKLVVERSTNRVLGCHMVGMDAPEIIQGFAVALNCGATKRQFDRTIGLHPTAAEEFVTMHSKAG